MCLLAYLFAQVVTPNYLLCNVKHFDGAKSDRAHNLRRATHGGFVPSMFYILLVIVYESNIGNLNCMHTCKLIISLTKMELHLLCYHRSYSSG